MKMLSRVESGSGSKLPGRKKENEEKAAGPKPDKCLPSRGREEKKGKQTVKRNGGKEGVCNAKINYRTTFARKEVFKNRWEQRNQVG